MANRSNKFSLKCFVPSCHNSTDGTPDKFFISVPTDERRQLWLDAVGVSGARLSKALSCCEDHFNLPEDVINYEYVLYVKNQGFKPKVHIKHHVLPRIPRLHQSENEPSSSMVENESMNIQLPMDEDPLNCEVEGLFSMNIEPPMDEDPLNCEIAPSLPHERDEGEADNFSIQLKSCCSKLVRLSFSKVREVSVPPASTPKVIANQNKRARYADATTSHTSQTSNTTTDSSKAPTASQGSSSENQEFTKPYNQEQHYLYCMWVMKQNLKCYLGINNENTGLISALAEITGLREDDIFIVFRKLKCYESNEKLGHIFNKSDTTISRIINHSTPILAGHLKQFIFWPERDVILANLPTVFRTNYSKVQCIIDCYEIQTERPTNAALQAELWSDYKGCHTLKYLIGCTPDGFICFLSEGVGGRISDKNIVGKSGFLDKLQPNTQVMADRGFKHIDSDVMLRNCELVRPPSVSSQEGAVMSKDEVRQSKTIASLRVHVERVIKRIRDFALMKPHATVSHDLFDLVDDFVIIVCALINMSTPIFR